MRALFCTGTKHAGRLLSTTTRWQLRENVHPIQGFTADLLDAPLYSVAPRTKTAPETPPIDELPKTDKEETLAKVRVVFGSRLAGPGERRKAIQAASTEIAGVVVPPKPEEPDNCCMSGCANCVWDQFRDEYEEWDTKMKEARAAQGKVEETGHGEMFGDIPVGIREFMKTEKKVKERRRVAEEMERSAANA